MVAPPQSLFFPFIFLLSFFIFSHQQQDQPLLNPAEQESVYTVLESINPTIPWRSLFPDDLCISSPHGVVCDIYNTERNNTVVSSSVHISELSFGYVSDYNPNPPCFSNSTLDPALFTSFKHLRKLFFYKCFTDKLVSLPSISPSFSDSIEELVFIENPALVGNLSGISSNFTSLKRVVVTGNGISGLFPDWIGDSVSLEELTMSRNQVTGVVSTSLEKLKKLMILDLSQNRFTGDMSESIGNLLNLLKLDFSENLFTGEIPASLVKLQSLEFLDLSYNRFGNFGIPVFFADMPALKQLHLNGVLLGGQIPEIWKNLGGIQGIGFSKMGLVGNIPTSMGVYLKNLSYLGLDSNNLSGIVPLPFSAKAGQSLKLQGNPELCVIKDLDNLNYGSGLGHLRVCSKQELPNFATPVLISAASVGALLSFHSLVLLGPLVLSLLA